MKEYIAILDFDHLENPMFLKSFAQALAKHGNRKGIIIHGDSEYTNRIMQGGIMREEARIRAMKDLNRRLVGLFADYGVATIGIHGFQKGLAFAESEELKINEKQLQMLPKTPVLLISSLVEKEGTEHYVAPIEFALAYQKLNSDSEIVLFSKQTENELFVGKNLEAQKLWQEIDADFEDNHLPNEFISGNFKCLITTSLSFSEWPSPKNATFLQ